MITEISRQVHKFDGWAARRYVPEPPTNTLPNPSTTNDPGEIGVTMLMQGLHSTNSVRYDELQREANHLKCLSALLTITNNLTDHSSSNAVPSIQRVILSNGENRPISLETGLNDSANMIFNRGGLHTTRGQIDISTELRPLNSNTITHPHGITFPNADNIVPSLINIGIVMDGGGTGRDYMNALTSFFYAQHQFSATSVIYKHLGSGVLGSIAGSLGALAKPVEGALKFTSIFGDLVSGPANARSVQGDILRIADGGSYSRFQEDFAFRGIVITEAGQPPQLLSWPTVNTIGSLNALSTTFENHQGNLESILAPNIDEGGVTFAEKMAIVSQGGHSLEDLLSNGRAFELYSILNGVGVTYFREHAQNNWNTQENRVELTPASNITFRNTDNTTNHAPTPDNADGIMAE